ncbi:MAG: hypothetical protein OXB97_09155, partial [Rhodospirillales bacterium]|nr:hypothetical protein [Rhodospirillales bacterium]
MAALLAAHLFLMAAVAAAPSAAAMQILDAADHAEIAAEICAATRAWWAASRICIAPADGAAATAAIRKRWAASSAAMPVR